MSGNPHEWHRVNWETVALVMNLHLDAESYGRVLANLDSGYREDIGPYEVTGSDDEYQIRIR